jgi:tetratricopeptide (TPR) repeat protein
MSGRAVSLVIATCILTSISFCQVPDPMQNLQWNRGANDVAHFTSISGAVSGSNGEPLSDARVELRELQTGRTFASAYTNNAGNFEFDNLPAASYNVVVSRGLAESTEHVMASEGGANLRIRLNTADAAASHADGNATVSVAEYKVPQKARDALHKAEIALAKNRLDDANKELAKALQIYPQYAPALTLHGVLALDHNQTQTAVNDFDQAIHSDPSFALAYTGMAAAMNQLEKFEDAIRSAGRAVALAPNAWQSYFELGKAYMGKQDYRSALTQLDKAQQFLAHDFAPLHLIRAHAMIALQEYAGAAGELQAFLTLAPQDPSAGRARETLDKVKAVMASAEPAAAGTPK